MFWEGLPQRAYFEVYAYSCEPVELEVADRVKPVPQGVAAVIYEELFLAGHGGSCRDFYFQEVASWHDAPFEQVQGINRWAPTLRHSCG